MKKILYILLGIGLASCALVPSEHRENVVAEVNGQQLTKEQLAVLTSSAGNAQDSAAIAEAYIRQWAIQILEYEEARDRADADIEKMVEDYRRSLYVHEYEQQLVARHQPKEWPDSMVEAVYATNREQLLLREPIVKGVLLVVPQGAPKMDYLKHWLKKLDDKNIEKIEKYAFQYATGYEYFPNEWRSANQILMRMPMETDLLSERMAKNSQVVLEDSNAVYILQVTDKRIVGDVMPADYAKERIDQILLSHWQVGYLQQRRNKLYNEAVRFNKLKIYE
ncbi:MAG: hypothetical protein MJZ65_02875 [Paludibacteraceae bacterium]|nr:hypothetical protein [Paludibacteraceae bacterium]